MGAVLNFLLPGLGFIYHSSLKDGFVFTYVSVFLVYMAFHTPLVWLAHLAVQFITTVEAAKLDRAAREE